MPVNENRFGLIDFPILTSSARCFTSFSNEIFQTAAKNWRSVFPSQDQSRVYYIIIDMRPCVMAIKSRVSPVGGCHCFAFFLSCIIFFFFSFFAPSWMFLATCLFYGPFKSSAGSKRKKKQTNKTMAKKKKNWLCCRSSWRLVVAFALWNLLGAHLHTHTHAIQSVTFVCVCRKSG